MKRFFRPVTKQTEAQTSQTPTSNEFTPTVIGEELLPSSCNTLRDETNKSINNSAQNVKQKSKRFYFWSDGLLVQYKCLVKETESNEVNLFCKACVKFGQQNKGRTTSSSKAGMEL